MRPTQYSTATLRPVSPAVACSEVMAALGTRARRTAFRSSRNSLTGTAGVIRVMRGMLLDELRKQLT